MQNHTVGAALLASQQLLAEEEQAAARAAAKQAKKERQKAKKRQQQQEQEQEKQQQRAQQQQQEQQPRVAATDACAVEEVQASMTACKLPEQQQQPQQEHVLHANQASIRELASPESQSQTHAESGSAAGPTPQTQQSPAGLSAQSPLALPERAAEAEARIGGKQSDADFMHKLIRCPLTKVWCWLLPCTQLTALTYLNKYWGRFGWHTMAHDLSGTESLRTLHLRPHLGAQDAFMTPNSTTKL